MTCGACSGKGCAHCNWERAADFVGAGGGEVHLKPPPPKRDRPDQNAAKEHKVPFELIPLGFVAGMARVMEAGLKMPGRYPDCWKELDSAKAVRTYHGAIMRHLAAEQERGPWALDPLDGHPHLLHVATSAMIELFHADKLKREKGKPAGGS